VISIFALIAFPIVLVFGWEAVSTYRTNNVCDPGYHIVQSNADAIKQAKIRFNRARYGSHGVAGHLDEKPELVDFSRLGDSCCLVTRSRNMFGVIGWQVGLDGETVGEPTIRKVSVSMIRSNCEAVFTRGSFIMAEPNSAVRSLACRGSLQIHSFVSAQEGWWNMSGNEIKLAMGSAGHGNNSSTTIGAPSGIDFCGKYAVAGYVLRGFQGNRNRANSVPVQRPESRSFDN
jgi:hypothetical protein